MKIVYESGVLIQIRSSGNSGLVTGTIPRVSFYCFLGSSFQHCSRQRKLRGPISSTTKRLAIPSRFTLATPSLSFFQSFYRTISSTTTTGPKNYTFCDLAGDERKHTADVHRAFAVRNPAVTKTCVPFAVLCRPEVFRICLLNACGARQNERSANVRVVFVVRRREKVSNRRPIET